MIYFLLPQPAVRPLKKFVDKIHLNIFCYLTDLPLGKDLPNARMVGKSRLLGFTEGIQDSIMDKMAGRFVLPSNATIIATVHLEFTACCLRSIQKSPIRMGLIE
jgi:hypothetical protein